MVAEGYTALEWDPFGDADMTMGGPAMRAAVAFVAQAPWIEEVVEGGPRVSLGRATVSFQVDYSRYLDGIYSSGSYGEVAGTVRLKLASF